MAVSDQEVSAWLAANPFATDAQIAAAMDQYGVSSAQLARVTGLSVPMVEQRKAAAQRQELQSTFDPRVAESQYTLPSQRTGTLAERGDDYQLYEEVAKEGPLTYYQSYDAYGNKTGTPFAINTGDNVQDFLKAATMFGSVVGAPVISNLLSGLGLSGATLSGATGATIGGGGTLLTGGSLEDALKNALIAGAAGYGSGLLSGQGAGGTGMSTAEAADLAAGLDPDLAGDYSWLFDTPTVPVTPTTNVPSVPVVQSPTDVLITGTAPINIPAIVGGATGGLLNTGTTTTPNIEVVSKKPTDTGIVEGGVGGLLSTDITTSTVTTDGTVPGTGETIEVVTDRPPPTPPVIPPPPPTPPVIPYPPIIETPTVPEITNTTSIDIPKIVSENPNITVTDLLKIITSLGAFGAGSAIGGGGGSNVTFVAPTQTMPVNTDDYYKAIQQYYNTYLPEMPRDVATPLQQWYSGTFKV